MKRGAVVPAPPVDSVLLELRAENKRLRSELEDEVERAVSVELCTNAEELEDRNTYYALSDAASAPGQRLLSFV